MLTLKEIREKLSDRQLYIVAERVKISRFTLYRIMKGNGCNTSTLEKLSNYLQEN